MSQVVYTPQAEADLTKSYLYTREKWGKTQAVKYSTSLKAAIKKLARDPLGVGTKDRSILRSNYRSYKSKRHVIFYRITRTQLEIIRILHESMDAEDNL